MGGTAINVGNPHIIFFVENLNDYDLKKIGPDIENHEFFPEKCNVTLAKVINKNLIRCLEIYVIWIYIFHYGPKLFNNKL